MYLEVDSFLWLSSFISSFYILKDNNFQYLFMYIYASLFLMKYLVPIASSPWVSFSIFRSVESQKKNTEKMYFVWD